MGADSSARNSKECTSQQRLGETLLHVVWLIKCITSGDLKLCMFHRESNTCLQCAMDTAFVRVCYSMLEESSVI